MRIAWRNLWRHRRRTLITSVAMAVGVAMCMAVIAWSDGMYANLYRVLVLDRLGHVQVHHPDYPGRRSVHDTIDAALVAAVEAAPGTRSVVPRVVGFALVGTEKKSNGAVVVGMDPAREASVAARIRAGRFLGPSPAAECTLGKTLAEDLGVGVGDTVVAVTQSADGSLGNALYTVVGLHVTGDAQHDRTGMFVHLADAQALLALPDRLHGLTVVTDDPEGLDPYAERLRTSIGGPKVAVQTWTEASPQTAQLMGMSEFASVILIGVVFAAAAFGLLNTMMMSVFERTRELGVLVAIGLRPGRMIAMVVAESVLLAGLSTVIGLALGGALDAYLVLHGVDLSASLENGVSVAGAVIDPVIYGIVKPGTVVEIVVSVFVVSVLASLWPAIRAARLEPVQAMRAD
ncbi:MAG: ABC transporter permease [Myxococcota bacterium]